MHYEFRLPQRNSLHTPGLSTSSNKIGFPFTADSYTNPTLQEEAACFRVWSILLTLAIWSVPFRVGIMEKLLYTK